MLMPDNTVFVPVGEPNTAPERTPNRRLPMAQRLATFDEVELAYTEEEALAEAARCLKCPTHWCANGCPAGVQATDFIARVREKDYEGAYQVIRAASALPEMCSRLCPQEKQCQQGCTRGIRGQAVGIGRLERFVVERHCQSGAAAPRPAATGKKVAVIGAGPSGLAAAQRLADRGHAVTVFEKSQRPGGLLEYGIPGMKLEKGVVARKVDALQAQGVVFCTGVAAGEDIKAEDLVRDFDAVILGVGTENARELPLEGAEGVQGICKAVDFLAAHTRAGQAHVPLEDAFSAKGKDVVIVGGGDTGSDCVGVSLRDGCASLTQVEMLPQQPGRQVIYQPRPQRPPEAKYDNSQEECLAVFGKAPHIFETTVKAVQADGAGRLESITVVSLRAEYDAGRRLTMAEVPGTQRRLDCQMLIIAAGFLGPRPDVAKAFGVDTTRRSNLAAPAYATNVPGVFACGDCRTGQSLVVKAMLDGQNCAEAVDAFLA